MTEYDRETRRRMNPYADDPPDYDVPGCTVRIGIVEEFHGYHKFSIAACRELGVSYRLIDIIRPDWVDRVRGSKCDVFVVWPSIKPTVLKDLFDNRVRILSEDLGLPVFPDPKALWLYENKVRIADWLAAHGFPQPRTWVFYELPEALDFIETAPLPLVLKTPTGATVSGVFILRERSRARRLVRRVMTEGLVPRGFDRCDRQWGVVYLQEFLPDIEEWRMVRLGDSYFGYRKDQVGDFHSGSHKWSWLDPGPELLDLLHEITETGGFRSMDVDVFRSSDGTLYVSELQTVFGASTPEDQLRIDGKPGRYIREPDTGRWVFEQGNFCSNSCANLRIQAALAAFARAGT